MKLKKKDLERRLMVLEEHVNAGKFASTVEGLKGQIAAITKRIGELQEQEKTLDARLHVAFDDIRKLYAYAIEYRGTEARARTAQRSGKVIKFKKPRMTRKKPEPA